jgi:hypothetical protein
MEEIDPASDPSVPSSKHGDEGVLEGVEISEAYEEGVGMEMHDDSDDDHVSFTS